jgi:3-hydroxyisobutyrate dehydrogenase-like beta-hydroxyacid dehydrogenase
MLENVGTLARLAAESRIILSVCPPANALDVARDVVGVGFRGTYVDMNAVAPETARKVGDLLAAAGATFVDGGIIGPPPRRPGVARLYLSGRASSDVAALFRNGLLEVIRLDGPIGAASAVKMAYAAWNKGSQALLMSVRALAMREGVDEALLGEWARSQPELPKRSENAVAATARKAWRFVGEMEEIAAAFGAAGLPGGFHEAAGEVYRRLAGWKDTPVPPSVADIAKTLAQ